MLKKKFLTRSKDRFLYLEEDHSLQEVSKCNLCILHKTKVNGFPRRLGTTQHCDFQEITKTTYNHELIEI